MRTLRWTTLRAVCGMAVALAATTALAQAPGALRMPASMAAQPQAAAMPPWTPAAAPGQPLVNAYGEPLVQPAQYCGPVAGGGCYGDPMGGCYGYGPGGGGYGMPGGMDPFGGAYQNTEQCGPHYFDFSAEYLYYQRDDTEISESAVFSTNGQINSAGVPPVLGPIPPAQVRLRFGDPVSDDLNGYRLAGRIDVGALSVAEFTYSELTTGTGAATINDPLSTQLFSIYSLYGSATNGDFGVGGSAGAPTGSDFEETGNALRHSLTYKSDLQSAEASFRRYWVGYNPRVSGTVMIGFRYTSLEEAMGFGAFNEVDVSDPTDPPEIVGKSILVSTEASNYLSGLQVGGDAWITIVQGLRIGCDGRIGLYANDTEYAASVVASDGDPTGVLGKAWSDTQVAFLSELRVSMVADIAPSVSLKAGYELLFIENVTLVQDGIGFVQPYGDINNIAQQLAIDPQTRGLNGIDTSGNAFYHGFHAGLEFTY